MPANESINQQLRDDLKTFIALIGEAKSTRPTEVLRALRREARALADRIDDRLARVVEFAELDGTESGTPVVLVVDDLASVRLAIATTLRRVGFEVLQSASSAEAEKMVADCEFDAVLVDMHLGTRSDQDGIQLLKTLSEYLHERGRSTVLLAMSIDSTPSMMERARLSGAVDWIDKPIEASRLIQQICGALWKDHRKTESEPEVAVDPLAYLALRAFGAAEKRQEIIRFAMADAKDAVDQIRQSIERGDAEAWKESMTALHGVAAQIGARVLTRQIEAALREGPAGDPGQARTAVTRLESELERVRGALLALQEA